MPTRPSAAYVPDRAFQHAFSFRGVDNVLLDHVKAFDVYGDFVYVGDNDGATSHNVTIRNSTFDGSGRQGIAVTAGKHVLIKDNSIKNVGRSLIDLEPNNDKRGARDVQIIGNETGKAKNFWIASKGSGANIDFTVRNNVMREPTGGLIWVYGVKKGYRGPVIIENNRFIAAGLVNDEETEGALFFAKVKDVTIRRNQIDFLKRIPAVEIRDSRHVTVRGNSFRGAGKAFQDTSPAYPTPDQR